MDLKWKKYPVIDIDCLPDYTQFRFAELEILKAIPVFKRIFSDQEEAIKRILTTIHPNYTPEQLENFIKATANRRFENPLKQEIISYLRLNGVPYAFIYQLTGASPTTIAKYTVTVPRYFPEFKHWDEPALVRWNLFRADLKLWTKDL